jgi:hypothetical protein
MKFKVWNVDWPTASFLDKCELYGVDIGQNGYADRYALAANLNNQLALDAWRAADHGMELHIYVRTYAKVGFPDPITTAQFASVTSWPSQLTGVLFDSERLGGPAASGAYDGLLAHIPTSVAVITPEPYPSYQSYTIYDHGALGHAQVSQQWGRVSGWLGSCRRVTDLGGAAYVAQRIGRHGIIGPQAYSTYLSGPESPGKLRAAIKLVAQASTGEYDGMHWGMHHVSSDTATWECLRDTYAEVNALDFSGLTAQTAQVAALVGTPHGLWNQDRFFWEMMVRSNIAFEVVFEEDCTDANLAQYSALAIPKLDSATLATLSATAQAAIQTFAGSKPVLTTCADGGPGGYGGGPGIPVIPAWATVLWSSRAFMVPSEWYPSFNELILGTPTEIYGKTWGERMEALVVDYRTKTGLTELGSDYNWAVRQYARTDGATVTFALNLATGEHTWTVRGGGDIIPTPEPDMALEDTEWKDEERGAAHEWDVDFEWDAGMLWNGDNTVWYDEEDD